MSAEASHPGADESYEAWIGRVIDDRYRIAGLLGEGGMGAVFEAEHLKLAKKVALKVIHPEFAGDGEVAERFVREAMASAQLEHPHVATATDYGTLSEGGAYLIMQYVQGESLREVLDREGGLGWTRTCEIMAQVADALSTAHKMGIVHRDLKPDNVMIEPRDDGTWLVKVLDFGIARVADDARKGRAGTALTRLGTVIGTPGYMAPEQALGERVDFRIDLYSLGLLISESVTGRQVFDMEDLTAIVTRQLTEDIPPLSSVAEVPPELDELVSSALNRDKEARPESAAAMRDAMRAMVLRATFQAVTSGEQELPPLEALERAARGEPTPMGVPLQRRDPTGPVQPPAVMPPGSTAAAARNHATARTMLAVNAVKKQRVPLSILAGAGCLSIAGLSVLIGIAVLVGGDDDPLLIKGVGLTQPSTDPSAPSPTTPDPPEAPANPPSLGSQRVPEALSQAAANLMISQRRRVRRNAAREILAHVPQSAIPTYLIEVAELERTTVCARKRERVVNLRELGDPRALPALERLDAQPRNGCRRGIFNRVDCYGCLRDELTQTLTALRAHM